MTCLRCDKNIPTDEQDQDMLCALCRDNYMTAVVLTQAFIVEGLTCDGPDYWEMNYASDSFPVKLAVAYSMHSLDDAECADFQLSRLQFALRSIALGLGVTLEDSVWLHSIGI